MPRAGLSAARLVVAGAELADEVGFAQVTLSALARRFGVKVASLYAHVRGAEDLNARIALLALDELAERADAAVAGRSGRAGLHALGDVYRDYAAEHPGRYDASRFPLDQATALASAGPRLAGLTRTVLAEYRLSPTDETHAVRLLGSTFHGFVDLERSGGFSHSAPDSATTWRRILDSLDATLAGWSGPAPHPTQEPS